ncbi:MAG: hypothetical protein N2Z76_08485 [Treponemataceae bacterium]|nr:hypothetical protein [Treponemataceae bacterium]
MKKRGASHIFSFCVILLSLIGETPYLFAQVQQTKTEPIYYIRHISFYREGISQPYALRNAAELTEGETLIGKDSLEQYIQEKKQLLLNQRALASVRVEYTLAEADPDGRIPVDLNIYTKDTWNIIALPYFKYDSNTGLELSAKARDYNFLGTLQPLKIDLGYTIDREPLEELDFKQGTLFIELDSNFPFKAFDLDWNLDSDHSFGYTYQYGFEYKTTTGLGVSFPVGFTILTVKAYQGFYVNEENSDDYKATEGERFADYWYLSNWLETSWEIPTGFKINGLGKLTYTPSARLQYNYRPGGEIGQQRIGPTGSFSHTLSFGRTDWIGNFRRGLEVSFANNNTYNFYKKNWSKDITATIMGHYPVFSWLGLSSRLYGAYYVDDPNTSGAQPIRGILASSVTAQYGVYLNTNFFFRLIRFVPSEWFGKKWMALFDFEQQWSPFFDMALVKDPVHGREFSLQQAITTAGLEVVTYPYFMRSFYVRISVGFDIQEALRIRGFPSGDYRSVFIGIGHHY